MPCDANTLFVPRPTQQQADQCGSSCIGLTDPVGCGKIGPRKNREKVREQIKDYCLLMLGAPVVAVELDQQNLDAAVDLSMQVFEDYAGPEYYTYYVFNTTPGRSVYTLPPDVGMVRNIYYRKAGSLQFSASDLGGALPIEYFYPGGAYASIQGGMIDPTQPIFGRAGEWAVYKMYEGMYSRLASAIGGWEWVGGLCNIKLYPIPCGCHPVIVHYLQKMMDFQRVTQALQEGAYAFCLMMLGKIRSKYLTIPGPQGGVQLDGQQITQEGIQAKKDWENNLIWKFGQPQGQITMD